MTIELFWAVALETDAVRLDFVYILLHDFGSV